MPLVSDGHIALSAAFKDKRALDPSMPLVSDGHIACYLPVDFHGGYCNNNSTICYERLECPVREGLRDSCQEFLLLGNLIGLN